MKNLATKLFSFVLIASILLGLCVFSAPTVSATSKHKTITDGFYYIYNPTVNRYFDIAGASNNNGAELQMWQKGDNSKNQIFYLKNMGNGWRITPVHSGKALDVNGNSKNDCAIIQQWDYHGGANQRWNLHYTDDGFIAIQSRSSGKVMDIEKGMKTNGAKIIQYTWQNSWNQKFKLVKAFEFKVSYGPCTYMKETQIHIDWYARYENHGVGNGDHLQVYNKKTGKSYGQRPDGSPSHGDKGDPPNIVKKKLKEKTGWDWDAKKEKRKNIQVKPIYNVNTSNYIYQLDSPVKNIDIKNVPIIMPGPPPLPVLIKLIFA